MALKCTARDCGNGKVKLTLRKDIVGFANFRKFHSVYSGLGGVLHGVARLGNLHESSFDLSKIGVALDPESFVVVETFAR